MNIEALKLAELADPSVIERVPELRKIIGMQNRIIHAYDVVDHDVLWTTMCCGRRCANGCPH